MLPLLVNCSRRNGSNGKTIVSPKRSFKRVTKALSRVGIFGLSKVTSCRMYVHILIVPKNLLDCCGLRDGGKLSNKACQEGGSQ